MKRLLQKKSMLVIEQQVQDKVYENNLKKDLVVG
jgi:hypothetical protein